MCLEDTAQTPEVLLLIWLLEGKIHWQLRWEKERFQARKPRFYQPNRRLYTQRASALLGIKKPHKNRSKKRPWMWRIGPSSSVGEVQYWLLIRSGTLKHTVSMETLNTEIIHKFNLTENRQLFAFWNFVDDETSIVAEWGKNPRVIGRPLSSVDTIFVVFKL